MIGKLVEPINLMNIPTRGLGLSLMLLGLLIMPTHTKAQSTDLLRVEYLKIPENNTGINTSRFRFLVNVPFKVGNDNYLIVGSEYNLFDIDFTSDFQFDETIFERLHVLDLSFGYVTKLKNDWRFVGVVTPRMASNWNGPLTGEDFFFNVGASFWRERKDVEKPYRLVLGLTFNSTTGLPFPLPLVSYHRKLNSSWSYTLGIPKSDVRYNTSQRSFWSASAFLDGYFVNVQEDIDLGDGNTGSRISLSALIAAIGYQYKFNDFMSVYGLFGGSIFQENRLRDDKRNSVVLLNNGASFYIRTGFKISIF